MFNFTCKNCGGHKLSYQTYVSSESPLTFDSRVFVCYEQSRINEEDEAVGLSGYVCGICRHPLYHCGFRIENEKELFNLLIMGSDKREQEEKEYQGLLDEEARFEEQREQEEIESYQTEELAEAKN